MIEKTILDFLKTLDYLHPSGELLPVEVKAVWSPPKCHGKDRITFFNVTQDATGQPAASSDLYQFDVWSSQYDNAKVIQAVLRKELNDCSLKDCHLFYESGRALHEDDMFRFSMDFRITYKTGE